MFEVEEYLDLTHTIAAKVFEGKEYPWQALPDISSFIENIGPQLPSDIYEQRGQNIWVAKTAKVYDSAFIAPNTIICPGAEVRHCAFIRGNAIVGEDAVVGNSTELKNVILFDRVQVPHYNYIGDSILGFRAHLGAGAITSNVKSDKTIVHVKYDGGDIDTGLKKFAAIVGDMVEVGCGSVLNPGTVVGRGSRIYPLSMVRGTIPAGSVYKKAGEIVEIKD